MNKSGIEARDGSCVGEAGKLPNDISRCAGEREDGVICHKRDTCTRYQAHAAEGGGKGMWYVHPQIPGPCIHYRRPVCPQPDHGRKYMHGDTLICMECGGLIPAAPGPGGSEG